MPIVSYIIPKIAGPMNEYIQNQIREFLNQNVIHRRQELTWRSNLTADRSQSHRRDFLHDEKIQVVVSRVREFSHDNHNSFVYIVNNTHFIISAYEKNNIYVYNTSIFHGGFLQWEWGYPESSKLRPF